MPKWYVDQSRYMRGFACPFSRLLNYHAHGCGLTVESTPLKLSLGTSIHDHIERLYTHFSTRNEVTKEEVEAAIKGGLVVPDWEDLAIGLSHAYARTVLPWILSQYDLVSIEEEFELELPGGIVWMARPDVVVRNRETGHLEIIEFKSTSARPEQIAAINMKSLQTIMNAYCVSVKYNEPCKAVQIHILNRGTEEWRSYLTHAYYKVGQPPFTVDDWQPRSKRKDGAYIGKLYRKVRVRDYRPVSDYVWSIDASWCEDACPIVKNPLGEIHDIKTQMAIDSIVKNEMEWKSLMQNTNWQNATMNILSMTTPRTFACVQYNEACSYEPICFNVDGFHKPIPREIVGYKDRTPHHTPELKKED